MRFYYIPHAELVSASLIFRISCHPHLVFEAGMDLELIYYERPKSNNIYPGLHVAIVQKQDQPTGRLTEGIVKDILTNSPTHPHGIKVRLETGKWTGARNQVNVLPLYFEM